MLTNLREAKVDSRIRTWISVTAARQFLYCLHRIVNTSFVINHSSRDKVVTQIGPSKPNTRERGLLLVRKIGNKMIKGYTSLDSARRHLSNVCVAKIAAARGDVIQGKE